MQIMRMMQMYFLSWYVFQRLYKSNLLLLLVEDHLLNTDIGQFQNFGYFKLDHLGLIIFLAPTSLCGTSPKSQDLD